MNKKGFTLVELIGVIVILAILSILATKTYGNIIDKVAKKQLNEKILTIEKAAMSYGQDNKNLLTDSCTIDGKTYSNCKTVTVSDLISNNRIDSDEKDSSGNTTLINNVTKNDMKNDKVFIYRKNNRVYATMDCSNFVSNNGVCPQ